MNLPGTPLAFALLALLAGPPAAAQVGPEAWYFEIDGDYGSVLGNPTVQGSSTLPSRWITDGGHTTYAPKQGYRIDLPSLPACTDWYHQSDATYMGARAYRVEAKYPGQRSIDPHAETRRSEQMLLADWYTGPDSTRYFTLAFRFDAPNVSRQLTESGGFISQWHHGGSGQPPVRLSWVYRDGAYSIHALVCHDSRTQERNFTTLFSMPASPGVWYRMLFTVDPGPGLGLPGYENLPTEQGYVAAWNMNMRTGQWEVLGEYHGQVGNRFTGWPHPHLREGTQLSYQWKVGHYVNEVDRIILDYDNVAYGKRWNNITKNRLIGYRKCVLSLQFDEGLGGSANDTCWSWNGGQEDDPTMDYDNDGSLHGSVYRSADGVRGTRKSLYFTRGSVEVPIDETAFDFGNYVTVSAWFKTTATTATTQGLVSIDEDDGVGKLFVARSNDRISFGVRHPDGTYSEVGYDHAPGRYADGQWHHVVGTFNRFTDDNRRAKIYIDGVRVNQRVGADKPILRGDTRLVVGRLGASGHFTGNIDEVNVLNYTMTDAEVATLFRGWRLVRM